MIVPHSKPTIDQKDIEAVTEAVASGNIAQGKKVTGRESLIAQGEDLVEQEMGGTLPILS